MMKWINAVCKVGAHSYLSLILRHIDRSYWSVCEKDVSGLADELSEELSFLRIDVW